jgi:hypothetical protein
MMELLLLFRFCVGVLFVLLLKYLLKKLYYLYFIVHIRSSKFRMVIGSIPIGSSISCFSSVVERSIADSLIFGSAGVANALFTFEDITLFTCLPATYGTSFSDKAFLLIQSMSG